MAIYASEQQETLGAGRQGNLSTTFATGLVSVYMVVGVLTMAALTAFVAVAVGFGG